MEQRTRQERSAPILTELRRDGDSYYLEEWYCEPPAVGVRYRVIDEEWTGEYHVRSIRRIELA